MQDKKLCWVYKRPEGDLEVWAETKERALSIMLRSGYQIDPSKLVNYGNGIKVGQRLLWTQG